MHRNSDCVVDQDDGQVDFEAAQGEPDGGNHQGAEGRTPRRCGREVTGRELPCFPVDRASPTPASTANRAAARPEKASPIQVGVRLAFGFKGGEQVGGHHAQQGQPARSIDAVEPSRCLAGCRFPGCPWTGLAAEVMNRDRLIPGVNGAAPRVRPGSQGTRGSPARRQRQPLYSNICSNTMERMQTPTPEIPAYGPGRHESTGRTAGRGSANPEPGTGLLKAMSPGVVDFLFRQLVAGKPAEDVQWAAGGRQPHGPARGRRARAPAGRDGP